MPTSPAFALAVTLSSSSWPISPSITFCICAALRKRNGRLNTLSSSITGPSAPTLTRANWMAPICACSIAPQRPEADLREPQQIPAPLDEPPPDALGPGRRRLVVERHAQVLDRVGRVRHVIEADRPYPLRGR